MRDRQVVRASDGGAAGADGDPGGRGHAGSRTGGTVHAERGISPRIIEELTRRGHRIETLKRNGGGYQGILIDPKTNVLRGGSEARKDGCAAGY